MRRLLRCGSGKSRDEPRSELLGVRRSGRRYVGGSTVWKQPLNHFVDVCRLMESNVPPRPLVIYSLNAEQIYHGLAAVARRKTERAPTCTSPMTEFVALHGRPIQLPQQGRGPRRAWTRASARAALNPFPTLPPVNGNRICDASGIALYRSAATGPALAPTPHGPSGVNCMLGGRLADV